jgi:Xaa-Pro dipeptidase
VHCRPKKPEIAVTEIAAIQQALRDEGLDAWLLYDFRGSNLLARRVLGMQAHEITSRRWFYCIPAGQPPRKLVHRIEPGVLDHLPGTRHVYLRWQELHQGLQELLAGCRRVAMEYAPRGNIPYLARVDAGTVELVRDCGAEVVSSGDLVQQFEATWDDEQWHLHQQAGVLTDQAFDVAWRFIVQQVQQHGEVRETQVQQAILEHFRRHALVTDHPPIVAAGPHSSDPHFAPSPLHDAPIRQGDFVLVDLWAKLDQPRAVYSDLTRVAYVGRSVPQRYEEIFRIVAAARDAAIDRVRQAFAAGEPLRGWQVDRAARDVIERAGYGEYFVHRTGHSIGQETHGNGANMDDLETHDERRVLPRTCFSIEPGIYLGEFGIRSEINVFVDAGGGVHVTAGEVQQHVLPLLQRYG